MRDTNYLDIRFTLDITDSKTQISIPVRQGDTNIRLLISFSNKSSPYTLTNGIYAIISGEKENGGTFNHAATILNESVAEYVFQTDTTNSEGLVDLEITLFDSLNNGRPITSPKFSIYVDEKINTGNVTELDEKQVDNFEQIYAKEGSREIAEEERKENEAARKASEEERKTAENERKSNEEARRAAEDERKTAEVARNTAETSRDNAEKARAKSFDKKLANAIKDIDSHIESKANETFEEVKDYTVSALKDTEIRLTNLEHQISPSYFTTDDSVAHTKIAPERACPYAQLNYIGGASVKKTVAGDDVIEEITTSHTQSSEGNIGDATLNYITLAPGIYHITFEADERIKVGYRNFDYDSTRTYLDGAEGDFEVTTESAGEYEFFYDGLIGVGEYPIYFKLSTPKTVVEQVKPTAIKVKTPNLLPFPYTSTSSGREVMDVGFKFSAVGVTWEVKADGSIVVNGTATGSPVLQLSADYLYAEEDLYFSGSAEGGSSSTYYMVCYIEGSSQNTENGLGNKIPKGSRYKLGCYVIKGTVCDNLTFKPMITYGNIKQPYSPANEAPTIYEIPESIQSIEGYGEGNPEDASEYNYIDFLTQNFIAKGKMVDDAWVRNEPAAKTPITFGKIIEVKGASPIEFVNDKNGAVPSSISYMLREE